MRLARAVAAVISISGCAADPAAQTTTDEAYILGGANAPAGKWPDVVAVRERGSQFCTGTLIAPTVVLTAGHCNDPALDNVLIGTSSLARPAEGEIIQVTKKVEYPSSQRNADLAVLVLASPSKFMPRPIASGWVRNDIKNGAQVALVGFGAIDRDGSQFIPDLQEATTTITDADCTTSSGCNPPVKPGGELGAGGMGIDTCGGDSGGPLYLATDYGTFLAGATSRGYDDNQFYCSEGGIYVRPDKFVEWIEMAAGVPVARGPEPTAEAITVVRGNGAETSIVHNDPKSDDHTFAITTPMTMGTAAVRDDGRLRVCPKNDITGPDSLVVTVTDKQDPTRTATVKVPVTITDGDAGDNCDPNAFEDDGGGCCDSGRSAGGALPLSLGVLAFLIRRRRR
jgi:endonuclease G